MFCRSCGTMIPDNSNFCPKCGIKVALPRQAVQRTSYVHSHPNIQAVKRAEQNHKVDGRLLREIAMLVGGLVVIWIGYAMCIGSTLSRYFSVKTSVYQAEFGRSAPEAMQWTIGIGGFLINVAGSIGLYVAVCALAQRFGTWRRQNKVVGTIFALIICLVVLVCFSLKTSATGQFGLWDYLIMAAIFGGMWKGERQNGEQPKDGLATSNIQDDSNTMAGLAKKPEGRPRNCMTVFGEECRSRRLGRSAEAWQSTWLGRVGKRLKKVIWVIVVIVVVAIIWGISAYEKKQRTEHFLTLVEAKNYDAAARLIDNIDVSDAHVQFFLGEMYYYGNGVAKDDEIAVGWYRKAAKQGSLEAEFNLRHYLFSTREMPKRRSSLSDITWNFFMDEYYKHSIEERQKEHQKQGKVGLNMPGWAFTWIGGAFFLKEVEKDKFESDDSATKIFSEINDEFKKKDYILAAKLLSDFSYADETVCQFFNGVLAECRNDIKAAHRGYQLAAEEWCKEALFNLGVFYEFGVGVQRDSKLAAGYYQRSAIQGDKEALQRWQRLSDSNITVPDLNLVPIFDRNPWPDSSVLVKGMEFAALRDDVGRWWDVPFSKVKDFFVSNANLVDGKFFFVKDSNNGKTINHYEIRRDRIRSFDTKDSHPAVERWNGKEMQFIEANDVQAVRNIVLYYILVTGKDEFAQMNSGKKFEDVVTIEMLNCDDGNGGMPIYKLMTDRQLLKKDLQLQE